MKRRSSHQQLMRPAQLLGLAFMAALFTFLVTIFAMGIAQNIPAAAKQEALIVGGIAGGGVFVVTLVAIALLLLAVDPATVSTPIDGPVLLPRTGETPDGSESDAPSEKPEN